MAESEEVGVYKMPTANTSSDAALDICSRLREHFNVLIYGPPGTGKTHIMQEVVQNFAISGSSIDTKKEKEAISATTRENVKIGWVTFHQSYSYEEFIVGLRPDPSSSKQLSLVAVPGLLLELAEYARQPGNSSLLIIDEINRGNVSRIFGEFITLLEEDKRLADDGNETSLTVNVRLPYIKATSPVEVDVGSAIVQVPNPFTMPRRLYTLASMNSVDKSIAPLDTALRRRFQIVNLEPDLIEMSKHMGLRTDLDLKNVTISEINTVDDVKILSLALLDSLNRGISFYLGPEYALGQWYLSNLAGTLESPDEAKASLGSIWKSQLFPQLEELFHGRIEQLQTVLSLPQEGDVSSPIYLQSPPEAVTELGGASYLGKQDVSTEELMRFLLRVSGIKKPIALAADVTEEANEQSQIE